MNTWLQQLVSLLLVLCLFLSGCATTRGPATCAGDDAHVHAAHADPGGLQPTGHHHGKAAMWIAVGFLIGLVVVVDLLILPFTYHDPFPCCHGVLRICR